jgi:hypothetical protein
MVNDVSEPTRSRATGLARSRPAASRRDRILAELIDRYRVQSRSSSRTALIRSRTSTSSSSPGWSAQASIPSGPPEDAHLAEFLAEEKSGRRVRILYLELGALLPELRRLRQQLLRQMRSEPMTRGFFRAILDDLHQQWPALHDNPALGRAQATALVEVLIETVERALPVRGVSGECDCFVDVVRTLAAEHALPGAWTAERAARWAEIAGQPGTSDERSYSVLRLATGLIAAPELPLASIERLLPVFLRSSGFMTGEKIAARTLEAMRLEATPDAALRARFVLLARLLPHGAVRFLAEAPDEMLQRRSGCLHYADALPLLEHPVRSIREQALGAVGRWMPHLGRGPDVQPIDVPPRRPRAALGPR